MLLQFVSFHSFLWLSSIRVCVCVCVCVHTVFIDSALDGHLSYLRILAVVNNAAMRIKVIF